MHSPYLILRSHAPIWAMVVVGSIILLCYARRSSLATALGLLAMCGFAAWALFDHFILDIVNWWFEPGQDTDRFVSGVRSVTLLELSWLAGSTLLLVLATVAGRKKKSN